MKIVIAAGGTGGHFFPGLSVAKEAQKRGHVVSFFVRSKDMSIASLQQGNLGYVELSSAGFSRSLSFKNVKSIFLILRGFFQARRALSLNKPDALLAMGGYLSVPAAMAAKTLSIPVFLHEQNLKPGLANRAVSRWAQKVAVSFSESAPFFRGKAVETGNPIREEIIHLPEASKAREKFNLEVDKPTLLVFGGSQGARAINDAVLNGLLPDSDLSSQLQIIHLSGKRDEERVKRAYQSWPGRSYSSAFCSDMASALAAADFVVSRSGASAVSELLAAKKPSVLIPYPFATGDHQRFNAQALSEKGAAILLLEKDLTPSRLVETVRKFFISPDVFQELKRAFENIPQTSPGAAGAICSLIEKEIEARGGRHGMA